MLHTLSINTHLIGEYNSGIITHACHVGCMLCLCLRQWNRVAASRMPPFVRACPLLALSLLPRCFVVRQNSSDDPLVRGETGNEYTHTQHTIRFHTQAFTSNILRVPSKSQCPLSATLSLSQRALTHKHWRGAVQQQSIILSFTNN